MTEQATPGEVFKEYVKALIVEIASETPGASMVPDNDDVQNINNDIQSIKRDVDSFGISLSDLEGTLEDINLDELRNLTGVSERLDIIESGLSEINSATLDF